MPAELHITGYSTALYSTWFFIDNFDLLFDAGDGVSSLLMQKSRAVKNVFISHADRDHLAGLLMFNQLNARGEYPVIHFPADCGSFGALDAFQNKFDPHVKDVDYLPIAQGDVIALQDGLEMHALRNNHVKAADDVTKSLSFKLYRTKRKLKAEHAGLSEREIKALVDERGRDSLTEQVSECIIAYSGDCGVQDDGRWDDVPVLIHEATFIGDAMKGETHGNAHSFLKDVIKLAAESNLEKLVISHFSPRYEADEIDAAIRKCAREFSIRIPIWRVLPGKVHRDIFEEEPINS